MNCTDKVLTLLLSLSLCAAGVLSSCAGDYDITGLDKTVSVGGGNFVIPLCTTKQLPIDSIFSVSGATGVVCDEVGNFIQGYTNKDTLSFTFLDIGRAMARVSEFRSFKSISVRVPVLTDEDINTQSYPKQIRVSASDSIAVTFDYSKLREEHGVERLDSVFYNDFTIGILGSLSVKSLSSIPEGTCLSVNISLPSRYRCSGKMITESSYSARDSIKYDGSFSFGNASVNSILFPSGDSLGKYIDVFLLEKLALSIPDTAAYRNLMGKDITVSVNAALSSSSESHVIVPQKAYAALKRTFDPVRHVFVNRVRDDRLLKAVFTYNNPYMLLDLTSNSASDMMLNLKTFHYSDGTGQDTVKSSFNLAFSQSPSEKVREIVWLSEKSPVEYGYKYVPMELSKLFSALSDSLEVVFTPSIGELPSGKCDGASHLIWFGVDTYMAVDYSIHAPMRFKPGMSMEWRDTLKDISQTLRNIMEHNDVSLEGSLKMTIPLALKFYFRMLGENGKYLEVSSSEAQIPSCRYKSVPVDTTCTLSVKKFSSAQKVQAIEVVYNFLSGEDENIILNRNDYLQMNVRVSVPGGVVYDLDQL